MERKVTVKLSKAGNLYLSTLVKEKPFLVNLIQHGKRFRPTTIAEGQVYNVTFHSYDVNSETKIMVLFDVSKFELDVSNTPT